jgi:hypothetical protein
MFNIADKQYCSQQIMPHLSLFEKKQRSILLIMWLNIERYLVYMCHFLSTAVLELSTDTNSFKKYHKWRGLIPRTCVEMFKLLKISIILWNLRQIFGVLLLISHLNLKWTSQFFVLWISFNLKLYTFSLSFPSFPLKS